MLWEEWNSDTAGPSKGKREVNRRGEQEEFCLQPERWRRERQRLSAPDTACSVEVVLDGLGWWNWPEGPQVDPRPKALKGGDLEPWEGEWRPPVPWSVSLRETALWKLLGHLHLVSPLGPQLLTSPQSGRPRAGAEFSLEISSQQEGLDSVTDCGGTSGTRKQTLST